MEPWVLASECELEELLCHFELADLRRLARGAQPAQLRFLRGAQLACCLRRRYTCELRSLRQLHCGPLRRLSGRSRSYSAR